MDMKKLVAFTNEWKPNHQYLTDDNWRDMVDFFSDPTNRSLLENWDETRTAHERLIANRNWCEVLAKELVKACYGMLRDDDDKRRVYELLDDYWQFTQNSQSRQEKVWVWAL